MPRYTCYGGVGERSSRHTGRDLIASLPRHLVLRPLLLLGAADSCAGTNVCSPSIEEKRIIQAKGGLHYRDDLLSKRLKSPLNVRFSALWLFDVVSVSSVFAYLVLEERRKTMKRQTLARVGIFAVVLAAGGLGAGVGAAHAGVITLDVSGSLSPTPPATCSAAGCTLGGDIVIDNTAGTVNSADVTMTGGTPNLGPFTSVSGIANFLGITEMTIADSADNRVGLFFATPTAGSLVGYTGGPLSMGNVRENTPTAFVQVFFLTSGSLTELTPVPVPEPASVLLLVSALAGACTLLGRRSLWH
jgi:hypothetical protein